jgi:hypothetical protein
MVSSRKQQASMVDSLKVLADGVERQQGQPEQPPKTLGV